VLTVGLFPNTKKRNVNQILDFILQYFKGKNIKVLLPKDAAEAMHYPNLASDINEMKETIKLGITPNYLSKLE
jgi:NAD+ kinase